MSLTILNQNFYEILDPLNIIQSISVNYSEISLTNNVIFISEVGVLVIKTQSDKTFSYNIIADSDTEQQIYSLRMQLTGLNYSVSSVSEKSTLLMSETPTLRLIHSGSSSVYEDYVFWFNSVQFRVLMNDSVIVDSVSFQSSDEIISSGIRTSVSQFNNELVLRMSPTIFNVSQSHNARFKIQSGDMIYATDAFQIVARDPLLSECTVSGSIYNQMSKTESQLTGETVSIVLSLRFETWVDDENELRNVLSIFTSTPFHINENNSFYTNDLESATNKVGFRSALNEAAVFKTSEQDLTINIGKRLDIQHPERLMVHNLLPSSVVHSGREIVVTHPFVQTIYPSPGDLRVTTSTSVNYSEKDFWTSEVVLTIEIDNDEWQDVSLLSDFALSIFINAIKNAFTSDNDSWNTMVGNSNINIHTTTGVNVGLLHITFPQQSSSTFNINETIEVGVSLPASESGFHFLLSGATPPTSFFIVNAVQSYISTDTAQIRESEIWNDTKTIVLSLVDDVFIGSNSDISHHVISSLQSLLGATNIRVDNTSISNDIDRITIVINQGTRSSFNISHDVDVSLTFPATMLRNGNELSSPNILFLHTPVEVSISGINNLTIDNVSLGFTISISLLHDVWEPLTHDSPVSMISRSHLTSGWNTRIEPNLTFSPSPDNQSTLLVTIPPNRGYMVKLTDVVDIFINTGSTRNNSRLYIDNFTIQGASHSEREHHTYLDTVNNIIRNIVQLKGVLNKIKAHAKTRVSEPPKDQHFSLGDTVADRLQKINTASIQTPIALCKPALLNSISSNVAHNFALNTQSVLQSIVTSPTPVVSTSRGVPVCVPSINRSLRKQSFNIIFHKKTPTTLNHNGISTQLNTDSVVLVIDPSIDTIFIHGNEIINTQII